MKKIFRTVAALAVVMFAGCTTDMTDEVVAPVGGKTTVTVGLENSRTYLGDLVDGARKIYWSDGDKIAVNGVASSTIERTEDHAAANFSFDGELVYPYSILYPAEAYKDASTVTLANNEIPMAGYLASEGKATLQHLAGIIRLQVTLPAESTHGAHILNKVEVKGNAGEQLSGDFAIDYAALTLAPTSTADADKVLTVDAGKTLVAGENDDIFVVVPAGNYAEGITVRLIDDAGHYMDISSKALTIEKGEIKAMPVVEFVPTGTLVNVEIKSAADFVAFAKAYNAGDYFGVEPFVIHITEDIVFDDATSAEWVPIGNKFGADNKLGLEEGATNYWHGYLEGNGHSIKNWKSVRPLFEYTGGGSMVTNLTIDASCTLTANFAGGVEFYGPFVGYHRGNLVNCHNKANIEVSGAWTASLRVGGLVGRTVIGSIDECSNIGNIVFDSSVVVSGGSLCAGGLTGYISNAEAEIKNSTNSGAVTVTGNATGEDTYVGGISGANNATISNCTNTATAIVSCDAISGTVKVGGISASGSTTAVISGNANHAAVSCDTATSRPAKAVEGDQGRYIHVGGIVGYLEGTAIGNTNYASVSSASSAKTVNVGGIIGATSSKAVVIKNNTLEADAIVQATGAGRYVSIGGLVGYLVYAGEFDFEGDTGAIKGTVQGGNCEDTLSTGWPVVGVGGYFGYVNVEGVSIKNAKWQGKLSVNSTRQIDMYLLGYGGIVGYAGKAITIENATAEGSFKTAFAVKFGKSAAKAKGAVGGIIGGAELGGSIKNCVNKTNLSFSAATASNSNGKPFYMGGIVGWGINGDLSIVSCQNEAAVFNRLYNNNGYAQPAVGQVMTPNYEGGIIGVYGLDTTDGALTITDCSNSAILTAYRGFLGGIAGYVRSATITNSHNTGNLNANGVSGGIVSVAVDSSIVNCTAKSEVKAAASGSHYCRIAGIAASLEGTSTIDNCAYFGDVVSGGKSKGDEYYGGLVGYAASTATIKNSKFGGSVLGTTISASNYVENLCHITYNGGVVPEETTPTVENCSYWDGN